MRSSAQKTTAIRKTVEYSRPRTERHEKGSAGDFQPVRRGMNVGVFAAQASNSWPNLVRRKASSASMIRS
jgi:hypothetical protein